MLSGDDVTARVAAILRVQRASILAVDSAHSQGTWAEYVVVSDRVYTDTARTLRDTKADAVRELERIRSGEEPQPPVSARIELEDSLEFIDERLDAIVGMKAALRQIRTRVNPQDPFPGNEALQPLLVDALMRVRDMGAITPEVYARTQSHFDGSAVH